MIALLPQPEFFEKYNITSDDFIKSGLDWGELEKIFADYQSRYDELDRAAYPLFNTLIKLEKVHSVRYRIKDPEHVIEKIIRKKIKTPKRIITKENYFKDLTDLIGLRAIHLFKDEWLFIHQAILDKWHQKEKPVYYYRAGDHIENKVLFEEIGCKIALHPRHYRSVHYIIKTNPTKQEYFAEIQVRTLFEEGWSEIDHKVGYPYSIDNRAQNDFLSILNRLAGSADEMGTFIKNLQPMMTEFQQRSNETERKVEEVKSDINKNEKLSEPEKEKLIKKVSGLEESSLSQTSRDLLRALSSSPAFGDIVRSSLSAPETLKAMKIFNETNKINLEKIAAELQSTKVFDIHTGKFKNRKQED